jgi:hypothetical protein
VKPWHQRLYTWNTWLPGEMIPLLLYTDQTHCFDEFGLEIPCAGTQQDAEFKTGNRIAGERFQVMTDVVLDSLTGLTWCRNANPAVFPLDWQEAHDFINEMNGGRSFGRTGWRLPSRRELFTLISHDFINPALPKNHPFENVFPGYYWTRTPCRRLPDQAWYIHLGGGRIYHGMKHGSYMVWPVISTGSGDLYFEKTTGNWQVDRQTTVDRRTGIMWSQLADNAGPPITWHEALEAIKAMNRKAAGGYNDWRLPNIRELESLVDLNSHSPALPEDCPFEGVADGFWSSTTSVYEPRFAWVLYTRDGAVGVGFKAKPEFNVLAVRWI